MRRLVVFVVGALAAAALAAPADAAAVLPVVTIVDGVGVKPQVALGGGVAAVAYTDVAAPSAVHVAVRRAGAWVDTTVSDSTVMSSRPDVAVSGAGQVDVAWRDGTHVVARRQTSAGTWEDRAPVTTDNINTPFTVAIASNPRGDVAIAWVEFYSGTNVAYASVRRVGATAWSSPEVLSSTATGDDAVTAAVGVDDAGGVTVVWQRQTASDGNYILEGRRLPAGLSTWGAVAPVPASAGVSLPSLSVDRDGGAVVAWLDGNDGYAKASYWPAGGGPSSADPLEKVSELATAFRSPGQPVVAVIDDYVAPNQLNVWTWSPATTHFVQPGTPAATAVALSQLSLASDQNGHVLAAVGDSGTYKYVRPFDAAPSLQPLGGDLLTASPPNNDLAMDRAGDAIAGWSGYRPASGTQQVLAAPYDAGPTATLSTVPTWSLGPVALHWATHADTWWSVASSTVRRQSASATAGFGAWSNFLTTAGSTASASVARGTTACFAVAATDAASVTGAWSATRCTAAPVDDRSLAGKKKWRKATGSGYYAGTALKTKVKGRKLTFQASGRRLALVASTCGACGSVKVLVNGVLARRISLKGAAANRVVLPIATYSSVRGVTVRIVTRSAKKVVIDGLGVSRS